MKKTLLSFLGVFVLLLCKSPLASADSHLSITVGTSNITCDNSTAAGVSDCTTAGFTTTLGGNSIVSSGPISIGGYTINSVTLNGNQPGAPNTAFTTASEFAVANVSANQTLVVEYASNNFSLPAGSPLSLSASQAGTFTIAQAGDMALFIGYGNSANTLAVTGVPDNTPNCVAPGAAPPEGQCNTAGTPTSFTRSGNFALAGHTEITMAVGSVESFSQTVAAAPAPLTATCVAQTTGQVNVPYDSFIQVNGGTAPYTFSLNSGSLPPGLTLNTSTGEISGTPTTAGSFPFTVKVTDSTSGTAQTAVTPNCGITIVPPTLGAACVAQTTGQVNVFYSSFIQATGGTSPYTFSLNSGSLPPGLTLNPSTGQISGTPTTAGSFSFTIKVTDSSSTVLVAITSNCSITIAPAPTASCVSINAVQGVPITPVTMTGSGGAGGPYTFSASGLPPGLSMSSGGTISGTPMTTGTFNYTVTVTDKAGNTGTVTCSVTVNAPPTATCVAITAVQGVPITPVTMTASGGTGGPYTFSATGLPAGLTMSSSGTISGTPMVSGTFNYTVTVTDKSGNTGTVNCSVTVAPSVTPPQLVVTKTPDSPTVTAGSPIGYTVTISNPGGATATGLVLTDPLPPGGNEFFNWTIDTTKGNPGDFSVAGSPGSQSLVFSPTFLASPDSLAAGQSISVHITSPTTIGDVSGGAVGLQSGVSSSAYLGAAGNYGVLYMVGSGSHNLSITNVTLGANIGVGSAVGGNGIGNVTFSGPGIITGRLDFAPGQTNQFSNNNGSNVGPASVNTNVANVSSAISTVTSLNSALGSLSGTSLAIHGTQTINESAGTFQTVNGVTYSVFTVTSYNENDGSVFTINGDGSGDPVVLNFGPNSGNINLGGDVALTGNGLSDDKVIWNFTSSNQNLQLNNNASSYPGVAFHGIILAPNDGIHLVNANLSGRIFGGDNQDMQLVSGLTLHAPIMNTATVSGSNVSSASSSATITVTGPFLPYAHFVQLNVHDGSRSLVAFNFDYSNTDLTGQVALTRRLPLDQVVWDFTRRSGTMRLEIISRS